MADSTPIPSGVVPVGWSVGIHGYFTPDFGPQPAPLGPQGGWTEVASQLGVDGDSIEGKASVLQHYIDQTNIDDLRRGFLLSQRDILMGIALQRDQQQWDQQDRKWIDGVVTDFMTPLFDALAGNGNDAWKQTFGDIQQKQQLLATPSLTGEFDTYGPTLYASHLYAAQQMAKTHITIDLRRALINNGVGDDDRWSTIGAVVGTVMTAQYGPHITLGASVVGRIYDDNLDPTYVRNTMRDGLRVGEAPIPKYVNPLP